MNEFRSETLSAETLERLNHLKSLNKKDIALFLAQAESVFELDKSPDVQKNGGIAAVVSAALGFSLKRARSYSTKRIKVARELIAPLSLERILSAEIGDSEILYQAARAVEKGMGPEEALQTFRDTTRESAAMLNRGENDLIPIPGRYDANAVEIFMEGFQAATTKGFANTVMLERLGVFMRESTQETLETFAENMELNS